MEVCIVYGALHKINGDIWYQFLCKMFLTVFLTIIILGGMYYKNPSFTYLKSKMMELLKSQTKKFSGK